MSDSPKRNVVRRAAGKVARTAGDAVGPHLLTRVNHLDEQVQNLSVDVRSVADDVISVEAAAATAQNLELLKAEFRGLRETVEALGWAIAPAAGLEGAEVRMTELRERVNAMDRRVRSLGNQPASNEEAESPVPVPPGGSGFDYIGFEQRFRGSAETATAAFAERYLPLLNGRAPVLDIGCGRGELVEVLVGAGIESAGVDLDGDMVADAVGRGLHAVHADGATHLRSLPEASLGAVTAIHVVEHLPIEVLVELLELTVSRLKPGGVFIAETPNPASLIVLGNSYVMDPSHVWPIHPSLFVFLCERAGFRDIELRHYSPATDYHLPLIVEDASTPAWASTINEAFAKLNHVLFGPQEYAIIARVP